jgi:GntR family transcriptional regulator
MTQRAGTFRDNECAVAEQPQTSPRRVRDLLRSAIFAGELRIDDRLDENNLVHEFATSRTAVREALRMLAGEGLVRRQPRRGTVVIGDRIVIDIDHFEKELENDVFVLRRVEHRRVPAWLGIRARLRIDVSEVAMTELLMVVEDEHVGVSVRYYHPDLKRSIVGGERRRVTRIESILLDARTS